jgi:hypothetical protein
MQMTATVKRGLALAAIFVTLAATRSGWDAKASANEAMAARVAGGFSSEQRALYHLGLAHINHVHQRPGQYTIRAVIQDERAREAQRARLRHVPNNTTIETTRTVSPAAPTSFPGSGLVTIGVIIAAVFVLRRRRTILPSISDSFDKLPLPPIRADGVPSEPGETFYWSGPGGWEEFHNERSYTGGSAGASFRIARGISIHSGSSRGHSKMMPVAETEQGTISLSNRRIIFIGPTISRELQMGAWEHAAAYRDAIHFDLKNARPIQISSRDPLMSRVFERIANGKIDAPAALAPTPIVLEATQPPSAAPPLRPATTTMMTFDSSHVVLRTQQGVMNHDRHELLVTLNMEKWNALSHEGRLAALSGARKTYAEQTCPDSADVAYVLFLNDKGMLVGEASPTSCDLI